MLITHNFSPVALGRSLIFLMLSAQNYCDGLPSYEQCRRD